MSFACRLRRETRLFRFVQIERGIHVHAEGMGAFFCIVEFVQQCEQAVMQLSHVIQFQRNRVALKSEPAQDVCGQIAAVDRQAC